MVKLISRVKRLKCGRYFNITRPQQSNQERYLIVAKRKLNRIAKLQFMATQAKPGPALAGLGIDMGGFTRDFNEATKERAGNVVPVVIKCYSDRSYEFTLKTTPASRMILKAAKINKGSQNAATDNVGKLTKAQIEEIAKYKLEDLNAFNLEAAMKIIVGTAHNMGFEVEGYKKPKKSDDQKKLIINENFEKQLAEMEAGIQEANQQKEMGESVDGVKDDENTSGEESAENAEEKPKEDEGGKK